MSLPFDALLFDVDGTLLDFKKAEKNALENTRKDMKCDLSPDEFRKIYHRVNERIWLELEEGKIKGEELKVERFRRFLSELNSSLDPVETALYYLTKLGEESHFLEGADSLLESLALHYTMGVITNGLTMVQEARFNRPEFNVFKSVVISEKAGVAKPDTGIFRIAAEELDVELNKRVLIIGDSLTSDIAGGIKAGISTCWYNPEGWENQSPWQADLEVQSFDELSAILQPESGL
jgi:YjjG family noncanonical pyrimidine nucleotidase